MAGCNLKPQKSFSKKVPFQVDKLQNKDVSCNQKARHPLTYRRKPITMATYTDDEFIMTDEFDAETIALMNELGI